MQIEKTSPEVLDLLAGPAEEVGRERGQGPDRVPLPGHDELEPVEHGRVVVLVVHSDPPPISAMPRPQR